VSEQIIDGSPGICEYKDALLLSKIAKLEGI